MRQLLERNANLDHEGSEHEQAGAESAWPGKRQRANGANMAPDDGRQGDLGSLRGALKGMSGGGSALGGGVSSEFGSLLGADLSGVRVHTSGTASDAASKMGARAFTHGNNIAFAPGGYDESSAGGRHVLAHELVHVVQNQRAGGPAMQVAARMDVGPSGTSVEQEAESGAGALTSGRSFSVSSRGGLPGISMFGGNEPVPTGTAPTPKPPQQATTGPTPTPTPATTTPAAGPTAPAGPTAAPGPTPTPTPTPTAPGQGQMQGPGHPGPTAPGGAIATPKPAGSTATPTPTPGPTPGPTAAGGATTTKGAVDLDAKVKAALEQRADPAARAQYATSLNTINQLKAQSLQYSFAKSGFGNTLFQAFVFPTEALGEHYGQIYKNNAYRGSGDDWQARIEGLRGVLHMFGDLAGVVAGWAGIAALVFGALALITSETVIGGLGFGALAAAADSVATIAALIKIILDVVDMILGIAQIVILCWKIKHSKDPAERARYATMLKKESNELAANVVSVAMQAIVIVATAGTGAAFAKTAEKGFAKTFGKELGKLTVGPVKAVLKDGVKGLTEGFAIKAAGKGVAAGGRRVLAAEAEEGLMKLNVLKRASNGRVTKAREVVEFTTRNQMNGAKLVQVNKQVAKLAAKGGNATVIAGSFEQLKVVTRQPGTNGGGPGEQKGGLEVPTKGASGALTTVQMWPTQIEAFQTAKAPLAAAKERMEENYNAAKEQLGEDQSGKVEEQLKKVLETSKAQHEGGTTVKTDAVEGKQNSAHGAEVAGQGKAANAKKAATSGQMDGQKAKLEGEGAQLKPPPPKEGPLGWLYNQTIGRIGQAIGSVQNWIRNTVSKMAISMSGLTKDELDMAGVENEMRTDGTKDDQATQDANEAAAQAAPLQQKVYELQKDKNADQQAAIQGMADTMQFLEALEEAEKALAEAIEHGNLYMEDVTPIIRHELETQVDGKQIDAAYVAPITGYADAFVSSLGSDQLGASAQQQATASLNAMKVSYPTLDIGPEQAQIGKLVASYNSEVGKLDSSARSEAAKVKAAVAGFVGTSDYEGVNTNAQALDKLVNDYIRDQEKLGDELYKQINAILSDLHKQIEAIEAQVASEPDEADPNKTPAPPTTPTPATPTPTTPTPAPTTDGPPAPAGSTDTPTDTPSPTPAPAPTDN